MKMPDYLIWAAQLRHTEQQCPDSNIDFIANALEQAFNQGRQLGLREGYEEGLDRGWAIEQDKWVAAIKQTLDNLKKAFPNGFHNPED